MPADYVYGKVLAKAVVDASSGEILAEANAIIDAPTLEKLRAAGVRDISVLYVNDVDRGAYISDTLRVDHTTGRQDALVEIYHIMRPGERPRATPPRRCSTTCSSAASCTTCPRSAA